MIDLGYLIAIIVLGAVILIQAVERHYTVEQEQREKSKLLAALLSKNVTEYKEVLREEKKADEPKSNPDEVLESEATDEEFYRSIKQQTK